MISLIYSGTEEKQQLKLVQLQEIDKPRKELDDSMHESSKVYECIAAQYPEDLKVVFVLLILLDLWLHPLLLLF